GKRRSYGRRRETMGFNTGMVILNDRLHEIEADQSFGRQVSEAIRYAGRRELWASGFSVLPSQHADTMQVVAIGGNTIRSLGYAGWSNTDEEILRSVARSMGFRLV